jgi:uncharacterized protein (TIGR02145 family)
MSILNCIDTDSCSTQITKSDLVTYIGLDLLCTNIQTSEDLTIALIKIDERICSITDSLNVCCPTTTTTSSSTTTTTTTECPCPTTTTTSSSSTTTTSSTSTTTSTSTSTSTTTTSSTSTTTTTSTSTTSTTTTIYIPTVNFCGIEVATKNLNVSKYKNGDVIPQITDPVQWADATTGAWCYYNNDITNQLVYGKLYNWYAVNDPRGLAPNGYHIPTDAEWSLMNACAGFPGAGGKMKEIGTSHWASPNTGATNSTGFTGLPGGYRSAQTTFIPHTAPFASITTLGIFWTATTFDLVSAKAWALGYNNNFISTNNSKFAVGISVRVVKD